MARPDQLCTRYILQTVCMVLALAACVLACKAFALFDAGIMGPLVVSAVFVLAVEAADALTWRWVAARHADSLPTFFTAVSGFRMLLAIFTMVGCWAAVGRDMMAPYCIVFMVFYLVVLLHHSLFFARVSNSHDKCEK